MITTLGEANEEGTYIVTAAFTDEAGTALIPTSITWSLRDENDAIVNSRNAVVVSVPAASINIVLSGNDLIYSVTQTKRIVTIEAVYTSTYGTGLPLNDECEIPIRNLHGVS